MGGVFPVSLVGQALQTRTYLIRSPRSIADDPSYVARRLPHRKSNSTDQLAQSTTGARISTRHDHGAGSRWFSYITGDGALRPKIWVPVPGL